MRVLSSTDLGTKIGEFIVEFLFLPLVVLSARKSMLIHVRAETTDWDLANQVVVMGQRFKNLFDAHQ